jgi:flagellar secretion chaperone FliS
MSAYATCVASFMTAGGRHQPHRQYQQSQVETASPTRLVVLLYDGAIRFCAWAVEAMQAKDYQGQNSNLLKAQRIIGELMSSLNPETGGEVATNLMRVYTYLLEQLVEANLRDRAEMVDGVLDVLRELRETWAEVDRLATGGQTAVSAEPRPEAANRFSLGEQRA